MKVKKKTPKKESIGKARARVWKIFSQYIRMRDCLLSTGSPDWGECFTCSEPLPFEKLQAGHFVPKHSGNYFSERGVHAQCRTCNLYGKDGQAAGMPLEYRRQIIKLYGEGVAIELEEEARQSKNYSVQDLEALRLNLQEKIKKLKEWN